MQTKSAFPPGTSEFWAGLHKADLPAGRDVYPEIFAGDVFPLQRTNELAAMMQSARSLAPQVVMEIGSDKGGSFFHWCKSLPTVRRAIAIEYNGIPFIEGFLKLFPTIDFCFVEGSSYEPSNVARVNTFLHDTNEEDKPDFIDCLFIDGDKNGTARDFHAYAPMVRPGGLVFIHDIEDRTIHPSDFFYSLAKHYRIMAIFDGREGAEAEKRANAGAPLQNSYDQWLRAWKWHSCGVGVVQM